MSTTLRAAVLGTGFIGTVHAHAVLAAGARLVAVAASTPGRAADAARRLGAERAGDAEEVAAADDVDVVHVATPDALHAPLARRALAAGKAVVCEKPLATTLDDARTLLAERPDLTVLVISGYAESEGTAPDLPRLTKPFRSEELAANLASLKPMTLA